MKSLMSLLWYMYADASMWCRTSTIRDFKTLTERVEHEGLSFLTITLPAFCKDFERSLDDGCVSPSAFPGFRRRGGLPLFLGGFLEIVFDRSSGRLLDRPDHTAIFFVRQLTLVCKKILLPCSTEREKRAFDQYVECERDVALISDSLSEADLADFERMSDLLWSRVLPEVDASVYYGDITPKHGKGATAERILGNAKYAQSTWHARLEEFFPMEEFLLPNAGFFTELRGVTVSEPETEKPVRVISVPKTLKTPRIIAIEPVCMQYTQQSLLEVLVPCLEGSSYLKGMVGFTDQTPNQRLAREGSLYGGLATLDLSEASDRVSNRLVKSMLRNFKSLSGAVQSCRTLRADVPGHGVIPLTKFASMGSALCFPMEAMVFLTLIFLGIQRELNRPLTAKDIVSYSGKVRVYGDDMIVPVRFVQSVILTLELFGLKVNHGKSFWTGKFRESCGRDYYDGSDVTVTYCRTLLPNNRRDVSEFISTASLRNQLFKAGLWQAADFLDNYMEGIAPFPVVGDTSPVVGRHTFVGVQAERMCPNLHKGLVKGAVVRAVSRPSELDGYGALLKFFLKRGIEPYFDKKHLSRYGRPESVDIKIRWASAT